MNDDYIFSAIEEKEEFIVSRFGVENRVNCQVIIITNNKVSQFFAGKVLFLAKKLKKTSVYIILAEELEDDCFSTIVKHYGTHDNVQILNSLDTIEGILSEKKKSELCIYTFADCNNNVMTSSDKQRDYLSKLKYILDVSRQFNNARIIHSTLIPAVNPLGNGFTALSEYEYELYAKTKEVGSKERFVIAIEDLLKEYEKNGGHCVATRINNIYGPMCENSFFSQMADALKKNEFSLTGSIQKRGFTYVNFACVSLLSLCFKGLEGNIYNIQQFSSSNVELYTIIFRILSKRINKELKINVSPDISYAMLSANKLMSCINIDKQFLTFEETLGTTICNQLEIPYDNPEEEIKYFGKLDVIKKAELDIVAEIKRICEKYNIKYFLVGGSLLGAIRHKGFIPWDDDLDVGMLRNDYDKFRKVAPLELNERFFYQSRKTESNSPYIFDKIRLNNTYFSTKYSNFFNIHDGVFIDILVYDQTSNIPFIQRLQILKLRCLVTLINIRSVNFARRGRYYLFSKLMLPLMRIFPKGFYHGLFNMELKRYRWLKGKWLIDGVGQNIHKGAFPKEWFDEIIEVPFENLLLPVPKKYDEYLRHWYGNSYMSLLPYSKRSSGHKLARVDLGEYIIQNEEGPFTERNFSGELFN